MSYPLDLEEYEELRLLDEIRRRAGLRSLGFCDYCARRPWEPPCKFPLRHNPPVTRDNLLHGGGP